MMSQKQNALEIIHFGHPEKILSRIPTHVTGYIGVNHQGYGERFEDGDGYNRPVGSKWYDIWGTMWHKEYEGVMGFPKGNPLADPSALKEYRFPDPDDERICQSIYDIAKREYDSDNLLLAGSHRDTLWEKSYMLVGMENMMEYMYTEPEYVKEVLGRIMDFQLGIARHYINVGVELVNLGDDLGTQNSLLLSPQAIREFLVPQYKRLFDFYKEHNVLINFHSCGHVEPLIDTFLELGVNILNPVQATANDLEKIARGVKGKIALAGGVSTAVIMDGSFEQIEQTVRETISVLGRDGGYFCMPDQGMPFPPENLRAFETAVEKYGRYPLLLS